MNTDDREPAPRPPDQASLFNRVYAQLRRVAEARLRNERRDHTLQATALVHEVWLKLAAGKPAEWGGPAQYYVAAAEAMRRILIDHARQRGATKRGSGRRLLRIEGVLDLADEENLVDAVALDELICRLEQEDAQAAQVVRLRFYAGLSVDETAAALGVGPRSVDRDWAYARAWLQREWQATGER